MALEVVVVVDVRGRAVDDASARHLRAPAELDVLLVEEELVVEAAELVEDIGAQRHRSAARSSHVGQSHRAFGRGSVAARPAEAADVDHRAGGVEELRLVEEAQARGDDPDLGIAERLDESTERSGLDHRVRVEEDERLAARHLRTEVAAAGEAEVLGRRDDRDAAGRSNGLELLAAAAVVDDDHLPARLVGPDRGDAREQGGTRVVRDDDDRGGIPHVEGYRASRAAA